MSITRVYRDRDNNIKVEKFSFEEVKKDLERLKPNSLEILLRRAITNTEIFTQRFRHCANRSFMVLRNYKGREISLPRQQLRTAQVLEAINEVDSFPMLEEAYREVLYDAFDLKNAQLILDELDNGKRTIVYRGY